MQVMMFVSAGTVHRKARQGKTRWRSVWVIDGPSPVSKLGPGVPRPWGHELRPTAIGFGPERQEADMDSSLHGPDSRQPVLGQGLESLGQNSREPDMVLRPTTGVRRLAFCLPLILHYTT